MKTMNAAQSAKTNSNVNANANSVVTSTKTQDRVQIEGQNEYATRWERNDGSELKLTEHVIKIKDGAKEEYRRKYVNLKNADGTSVEWRYKTNNANYDATMYDDDMNKLYTYKVRKNKLEECVKHTEDGDLILSKSRLAEFEIVAIPSELASTRGVNAEKKLRETLLVAVNAGVITTEQLEEIVKLSKVATETTTEEAEEVEE